MLRCLASVKYCTLKRRSKRKVKMARKKKTKRGKDETGSIAAKICFFSRGKEGSTRLRKHNLLRRSKPPKKSKGGKKTQKKKLKKKAIWAEWKEEDSEANCRSQSRNAQAEREGNCVSRKTITQIFVAGIWRLAHSQREKTVVRRIDTLCEVRWSRERKAVNSRVALSC